MEAWCIRAHQKPKPCVTPSHSSGAFSKAAFKSCAKRGRALVSPVANPMIDVVDEIDVDRVAEHGPYLLMTTGVVVAGPETIEGWSDAFEWCWKVRKASGFWLGDLAMLGEKFGEEATQVLEATGYAYQTIEDAKWVARSIESSRRREDVSFSVHKEIAKLPPAEQDAWLQTAADENLTREEVRRRIKALEAKAAGVAVAYEVTVVCTDLADQETLAAQLRAAGRHVKVHMRQQDRGGA